MIHWYYRGACAASIANSLSNAKFTDDFLRIFVPSASRKALVDIRERRASGRGASLSLIIQFAPNDRHVAKVTS